MDFPPFSPGRLFTVSSSTPGSAQRIPGGSRRTILVLAGAFLAAVVGGVLFQVLKPPSAYSEQPRAGEKAAAPSTQAPSTSKNYVGRVNGDLIKYDDLAAECVTRHGKEILESMINRMIIQQACEKQGIEVTNVDVNEEIKKVAKKFNLSVEQWLAMLQQDRDVSPAQYGRDIIWPMLALRKLAGEQVQITQKDLDRAFEREYGPRVKARIIVMDNQRRAGEVWDEARRDPKNFEQLVYKHSTDPGSRPLGGAIPPIQRHGGNDKVEQAAFALKEGEISGVIQVETNWVIIKSEGQTEVVGVDPKEVAPQLKAQLVEEKVQKAVAKVFEKLKAESRVDNYLTGVASGASRKGATQQGATQQAAGTEPIRRTSATASPPSARSSTTPPPRAATTPPPRSADATPARTAPVRVK